MMGKSWDDLRTDFCRVAAKRGVGNIADDIPADRSTVYRLIRGETQRPTRAVQAAIERVVQESKESTDDGNNA